MRPDLGGGGEVSVLGEHFDPARGVSLNDEGLVIYGPILIGGAVGEHGVDDAQHLVSQRHDGLFVPLADGQCRELVFEGATATGGGLGELAQQAAEPTHSPCGF